MDGAWSFLKVYMTCETMVDPSRIAKTNPLSYIR